MAAKETQMPEERDDAIRDLALEAKDGDLAEQPDDTDDGDAGDNDDAHDDDDAMRPALTDGWVEIGRLGRAHGVRGEVRLELFNAESAALDAVDSVRVTWAGRPPRDIALISLRQGTRGLLVAFEDVEDREAAARLTGAVVSVPRAVLPPAEDGEYYHCDVVGAVVYDAASDLRLGLVRRIEVTSCDVLDIRLDAGGSVLVPVTRDYVVSIGETPGRVVVRDLDHWRT